MLRKSLRKAIDREHDRSACPEQPFSDISRLPCPTENDKRPADPIKSAIVPESRK